MQDRIRVWIIRRGKRPFFEAEWRDPLTGKVRRKTTGTNIQRTAERFAAKLEKELEAGTYNGSRRTTWAHFRERYETDVLPGRAKKTADKAATAFNSIETIIGPKYLAGLDANEIGRWQTELRKAGLSESTIKSYSAHLKAALRWAKRRKLLAVLPEIDMPTRTAGMKGRPITTEEFERMLAAVPKVVGEADAPAVRRLLTGLWWSGLRLGEALALHWTDDRALCVDFDGKRPMFRIRANAEKGGKDRLLPMAPEFAEMLAATPEAEREGFVFAPRLPGQRTARPRLDTVSKRLTAIGKAAGVKVGETERTTPEGKAETVTRYAGAHDLRRAFGLRWAGRIMPKDLMVLMRHESIATTMTFYVGRNAQDTAETVWQAFSTKSSTTNQKPAAARAEENPQTLMGERVSE